ncbi:MAG: TetR/AcrR family transcriptional regulator [Xanthobacteraceae bacterium]|nr:TetR/AcrR family transcriptional regulator [Xanthobacteraceae bacterium]QYK44007.1 MAG: TetR/AcrR family transcriptional regulator [Xanthobacteraceae bacterium]
MAKTTKPKRLQAAEAVPNPQARQSARAAQPRGKGDEILDAALEEFSANGFAATRLDDVAKRAGVAKGTIYFYFKDKEELFERLLHSYMSPLVDALESRITGEAPARVVLETMVDVFDREVLQTRRKDILRLIISEGPRFPRIAEAYYRNVLSRVQAVMRRALAGAVERGEISKSFVEFPQLVFAPALVSVVWKSMFDRFQPLDGKKLMLAHIGVIFGDRGK